MFGFRIISEEKYRSEQKSCRDIMSLNDKLVSKNAGLEVDIKSLREQNTRLRAINAKRKEENMALNQKISKLKESIKDHEAFRRAFKLALPEVNFKGFHPVPYNGKCTECNIEQPNCKKYTNLSLCMQANEPSFQDNK